MHKVLIPDSSPGSDDLQVIDSPDRKVNSAGRGKKHPDSKSKHPTRYKGGKNRDGVYQALINLVPPHKTKYEIYAGTAPLTRLMKPCERSVIVELDKTITDQYDLSAIPGVTVINRDAIEVLDFLILLWQLYPDCLWDTFIYLDPPYPISTRRSRRAIYKHELGDLDHERLLSKLLQLPAELSIAISSYRNPLYDEVLKGWIRHDFKSHTRRGPVTESVYCNYVIRNGKLHDYQYVGHNFTRRQQLKRIAERIDKRVKNDTERRAVQHWISEYFLSKEN